MSNHELTPGQLLFSKLKIDLDEVPIDQLAHYTAVEYYLMVEDEPPPDATNLEKVRCHLESLYHVCKVGEWNLIKAIFSMPICISQEEKNLELPLDEYLIWQGLSNSLLEIIQNIIVSFEKIIDNINFILMLKARALSGNNRDAAHNIFLQIIAESPENSESYIEANARLGISQIYSAGYQEGLISSQYSLTMIEKFINSNSELNVQGKLLELKTDILETIALYEMSHSKFKQAIKLYTEALNLRSKNRIMHKVISPLVYLGILHRRMGEYNRAISYLTEAKPLAEKFQDDNALAWITHHLAWVFLNQGKPLLAEEQSNISLEGYKKIEPQSGQGGMADVYEQLGFIHLAKGEIDDAYEKFEMALKIRIAVENRHGVASCMMGLALASWHKREYLNFIKFSWQGFNKYYTIGVLNWVRIFRMIKLAYIWTIGKLNWTM
jgi:tetratricopeptide (TPR) repeat protein